MISLNKIVQKVAEPVAVRALLAWERIEAGVAYHPGSSKVISDPYPLYARMRRIDPVHRMRLMDAWALTRHEDVDTVLRDHTRFSSAMVGDVQTRTGLVSMLDLDPPDHTRLRNLVSQAFTPRSIERLRNRIERIAENLLDVVDGQRRFDLVAALAYPLPVTVIAEMLGVPSEDLDRFEAWSNDIALNVEPILDDDGVRRVQSSRHELSEYFEGIIEKRRREPREDIISALLAAEEEGDMLTHDELIATLILLLVAGNETTRNLIGNGILALLSHPDQLQRLRENPDLLGSAVKELLRFDPPVQIDGRTARRDVEIGGKRIRAGQGIITVIGAANRDPDAFTNPDKLDIGRKDGSHLSFGRGVHYCLGASLAEMEGRIAFSAILRRYGSIRLVSKPVHRQQTVLRGVKELWVEVKPIEDRDR